jgi:hypothetical protein
VLGLGTLASRLSPLGLLPFHQSDWFLQFRATACIRFTTAREAWLKGRSREKGSWSFPFIPFPSYRMNPAWLPGAVKGAPVLRGEANP